jgi:predicted transcriptional regulator
MADDRSASSPFHDVGCIFPDDVELCWVEPSTTVAEALRLMAPNRYSQVPVIADGRVRGVFSLWSLAQQLLAAPNLAPLELAVEDVMERIPAVTVDDPLDLVLEHLNRHDAVLVDSPHGLQAIATGTDVLNYFYRIAVRPAARDRTVAS